MRCIPTTIPEVMLIEPQVFSDDRGFFLETYQLDKFSEAGIPHTFVQDNHSGSCQGVLRGIHYQIRQPQGKLVRVVAGEIYDVAVDLRQNSPTFARWVGAYLSAHTKQQLWIPPGFGHGFYVVSEWAEVIYKATDFYAPQCERTIRWDDPTVAIDWPLLSDQVPIISNKDAQGMSINTADLYDDMFVHRFAQSFQASTIHQRIAELTR